MLFFMYWGLTLRGGLNVIGVAAPHRSRFADSVTGSFRQKRQRRGIQIAVTNAADQSRRRGDRSGPGFGGGAVRTPAAPRAARIASQRASPRGGPVRPAEGRLSLRHRSSRRFHGFMG